MQTDPVFPSRPPGRNTVILITALALLPGCWWVQQQEAIETLDKEVDVAQGRSAALERAVLEYESRLTGLEEAMRVAGASDAADLENIDEVNAEVNRLRGQIEVIQFELEDLKQHFEDLSVDFDRRQLHDEVRLRQLEKYLGVTPPPLPSDEPPCDPTIEACEDAPDPDATDGGADAGGGSDAVEPGEMADSAEGKLQQAVEHMKEGRNRVARAVLEKAMQDHRGAPELPEIRYRLAETWFNEGKWNKAVQAFQSVIDNHPDDDWAAWSMLREGDCFQAMGQDGNATLFYEEVVRLYAGSEAAKDAKKLLKAE